MEQNSCIVEAKLIERDDDLGIDTVLLYADVDRGYVQTNCGDFYMDYEISFDDFIKFAEFIKKYRKDKK